MSRSGAAEIDRRDENGARAVERLSGDRIGWLTTVAANGTPQVSPIWFLWDGNEILVYSLDSPALEMSQSTRASRSTSMETASVETS